MWREDIKGAFRCLPIHHANLWASWVAFMCEGVPVVAGHRALNFGSVASVLGWHAFCEFLSWVLRVDVRVAVARYVDDFSGYPNRRWCGPVTVACNCFASWLGPPRRRAKPYKVWWNCCSWAQRSWLTQRNSVSQYACLSARLRSITRLLSKHLLTVSCRQVLR